jgi:hypothetical protein
LGVEEAPVLTEDEKKRITAEEIFRQEVRLSLPEKASGRRVKVWKFLNSAFGLFLLSTIVIGGLSRLYVGWSESLRQQSTNERDGRMLSAEIAHRLTRLELLATGPVESADLSGLWLALYGANAPSWAHDGRFQSLFAAYKDQPLYGLLWQLSTVVERRCIEPTRRAAQHIQALGDLIQNSKMKHTTKEEQVPTGTRIYNYFTLPQVDRVRYETSLNDVETWSTSNCGNGA